MTDLKKAAQKAIEALDCVCNEERTCDVLHHGRDEYHVIGADCPAVKRLWVARRTLSDALAAPQPEPVAFYDLQAHKLRWARPTTYAEIVAVAVPELPLYAAQPQRQHGEIDALKAERDAAVQLAQDYAREAYEDVEGWSAYASDHFQRRWNLEGDLAKWLARSADSNAREVKP
jgi:hypothetical protein